MNKKTIIVFSDYHILVVGGFTMLAILLTVIMALN